MKRATLGLLFGLSIAACGDSATGNGATQGPAGPAGPAGNQAPALTLITPAGAFAGRTVNVQISGGGTAFSGSETVDFGDPGISVSSIVADGVDNLRLTLTIGANAKVGAHDVTVTSGGAALKLTGGFGVGASLKSSLTTVPVAQGGLTPVDFYNLDYALSPLNTFFRLDSGLNSIGNPTGVNAGRYTGAGLVDALATVGSPLAVQGNYYNPNGQAVIYTADPADPGLPTVTARAATALTSGTALPNQNFAALLSDNLYQFTTAATDQIVLAQFTMLGAVFAAQVSILGGFAGADGKFGNGQIADSSFNGAVPNRTMLGYLPLAGTSFLATLPSDFSGAAAGYTHTLTATVLPGTKFALSPEPPGGDTGAAPLATIASLTAAAPSFATDGQFDNVNDTDFIRYTAGPGTTRIYFQAYAPGVQIQVVEYSNNLCTTGTVGLAGTHVITGEVAAAPGVVHCISVRSFNAPKSPFPYRLILAAR